MADTKRPKTSQENIRFKRDKDREKVKGIFKYYSQPGGNLSFSFRKYLGDPIEEYNLFDGQTYSLPLGVVRHLKNNGWYPQYEYIPGGGGIQKSPTMADGSSVKVVSKKHRFGFEVLDFIDLEETPEIVIAKPV